MDGETFEKFLREDQFNKKLMSKFDDFLHKLFGMSPIVIMAYNNVTQMRWRAVYLDQAECATQALYIGSKESTPVVQLSPSDSASNPDGYDHTNKVLGKLPAGTATRGTSPSQQELIRGKIARNKRLLLETMGHREEDVQQEPRERGQHPGLASLSSLWEWWVVSTYFNSLRLLMMLTCSSKCVTVTMYSRTETPSCASTPRNPTEGSVDTDKCDNAMGGDSTAGHASTPRNLMEGSFDTDDATGRECATNETNYEAGSENLKTQESVSEDVQSQGKCPYESFENVLS